MSYDNKFSGGITIDPPLNAKEIKQLTAMLHFDDMELDVQDEEVDTDAGFFVKRTAARLAPPEDRCSGGGVVEDIRKLVKAFPGRTFGGYVQVDWDSGFGDPTPTRYVVHQGDVREIQPVLAWPDPPEGKPAE